MKLYLVACFDEMDQIKMLQKMFLAIYADAKNRGKFQVVQERLEIVSEEICVHFFNRNQIEKISYMDGFEFFGIAQSPYYWEYASFETKSFYEYQYRKTVERFGKNDSESFLKKYFQVMSRNSKRRL